MVAAVVGYTAVGVDVVARFVVGFVVGASLDSVVEPAHELEVVEAPSVVRVAVIYGAVAAVAWTSV